MIPPQGFRVNWPQCLWWASLVTLPPCYQGCSPLVIPCHLRGMETLLSIFTWDLPCSWLKAALLHVMGNLGFRILVDVMKVAL